MRSISVPFSITPDEKLTMPTLTWPGRCVCCGIQADLGAASLQYVILEKREVISTSVSRSSSWSGFPMGWSVPCCPACLQHQAAAKKNPDLSKILVGLGLLVGLGVGYALFLAGFAYNTVVDIAYAIFLGLLVFAGFRAASLISKSRENKARQMMTPACSSVTLGVTAFSDASQVFFRFTNDAVADEFAAENKL
jgi:hypothetical protein